MIRNYNNEMRDALDHKYSYNFDFDVMHPFMIRSFEPFFVNDNVLELGSYTGRFTEKLLPFFKSITCIEASEDAVKEAKERFNDLTQITIVNSLFEDTILPRKYDNVILTHVLEHIIDPISLLKKINDEFLSDDGRLFIACPNANAPSRQIAVKMGILSHNAVVTKAESEHGHQITYSMDTLQRDIRISGLRILHSSGIFFKALSNFQWDKLLGTDIISDEYLNGCYELGLHYPDLCSSLFVLCEKGNIK